MMLTLSQVFGSQAPLTFGQSKKILLSLYRENPFTFYCECPFNQQGFVTESSGYLPESITDDLLRLEWEHIVPASLLGRSLPCWSGYGCDLSRMSARQCCQKTSREFNLREANLYNIVPALKLSNRQRSNFRPGVIANKKNAIRLCQMFIDKKKRIFEPDDALKGFIARTYLRLSSIYDFKISDKERLLFQQWDVLYPKGDWEKRREVLIEEIYSTNQYQGDINDKSD